jgi:hypothetical protein
MWCGVESSFLCDNRGRALYENCQEL